jgi:antibiotic biosynthesis monooxygenase (ABM) superfamily enzyme
MTSNARTSTAGATMNDAPNGSGAGRPRPPSKHQLALMIWLAVFPTLTVLNLVLGDWLRTLTTVERTFVLATIAVPVVVYGLMPHLQRLRGLLVTPRANQ